MTDMTPALGLRVDSRQVEVGTRSLRNLEGQARRTEGATDRMGRSAMRAAGAFAAMAAATFGAQQIISTLAGFETSMAAVAAITRATDEELKQLRDTAKQLGATTEFSASQAADALKFLGMAGFQTADAIAAIPDVLNLATAAQMDLASAADISSNIMSAFGIAASEAARVSDVLAAASSRANTDVKQLGDAMKFVGPVASALGISMNDSAAAIGVLSDAGIQGGMAGTSLRRMLSSLANATPQATAAINALGLNLDDLNPKTNSIVDIVDRLAASGMDAAAALTIFGDRGGPAVLALVENNAKLRELTGGLSDVEGEAKRMADTMRDQLGGDLKGLMSAIEGMIIQLGESGLTNALRGIIQTVTAMARSITGAIAGITAFIGAAADATGVSGVLGSVFGLLAGNLDVLGTAVMATAVVLTARLVPAIGVSVVQAVTAGAASLLMYAASLGATSLASAAAVVSMAALRTAITVLLGPVGLAIALIGVLTAAMVTNGREMQRQRDIQQRYADMIERANSVAELSQKRLEDYRKKVAETGDAALNATTKVDGFALALEQVAKGNFAQAFDAIIDKYGVYAQMLEEVRGEQSATALEGGALFEAQAGKAKQLADAVLGRTQVEAELTKQLALQADIQRRLNVAMEAGPFAGVARRTLTDQMERQSALVRDLRVSLGQYNTALQAIRDTNVDAFAGEVLAAEKAAAEAAAEKVQETITALRQRLVIDSQVNDLQKEIVANMFKAGLAANDNSASAREIRDITAQIYNLEVKRTEEAERQAKIDRATTTIADLQREVDQLEELHAALRISDEAYMAVAEAHAIEDAIRRAGLEGMEKEIALFRQLAEQRNESVRSLGIKRGGDMGGGVSPTDATRARERFEGLETDLIAGIDNPALRLERQYAQQQEILAAFNAKTEEEIRRSNAAKLEMDRQYEEAKLRLQLSSGEQAFGALAGAFKDMLGEQSSAYKAAFAIQQAFVVATAALSISGAMAQVLADPSKVTLEQKLAAWATIAASSAQIMGAIHSVALGFQGGGYTGSGGVSEVAGVVHKGEVVWSQADVNRWGGPQTVDAMRRGMPGASNDNGSGRIALDVNISVDDDGRIQAYVTNAQNEAVQASVQISDSRTKARMEAQQKEASRPRISARAG